MIIGAIPYETFQERLLLVKKLKKEHKGKVIIDVQENMIFYEISRYINNDRFIEF